MISYEAKDLTDVVVVDDACPTKTEKKANLTLTVPRGPPTSDAGSTFVVLRHLLPTSGAPHCFG
jgi:hypothetical protein